MSGPVAAELKFVARAGIAFGVAVGGFLGAPDAYWLAGVTFIVACGLHARAAWKRFPA